MPARNGVTAALLVRAGWNGVDDVFSGDDNFFQVNAPAGNRARARRRLGERFEVASTDIKKWTVGTPIQAPLDALENIRRAACLHSRRRAAVSSFAWRRRVGAVVDNRDMPDICLQHMVAVMLLDGTASFAAAHDKARMQDPAVLEQRKKVTLRAGRDAGELLPVRHGDRRGHASDGTQLNDRVEAVRGTPRNPMSRARSWIRRAT